MTVEKVCIAGAGGFIGGHLTRILLERGFRVRAVDLKPINQWFQRFHQAGKFSSRFKEY